jgi:glucokinase
MAMAGVYLGGGIPTHIVPVLKGGRFLESFRRNGRFSEVMSRTPTHLMVSKVRIAGAATYGLRAATRENAIGGLRRAR